MNRPFARVLRLYAWLMFLHLWNAWRQNPLAWVINLINLSRVVFAMFFLETPQAIDNAIAGEVDQVHFWIQEGGISVPVFCLQHLDQLHPYPEAV